MDLRMRHGTYGDVVAALEIIDDARRFMRAGGNTVQWVDGYPSLDDVLSDIGHDALMVCEDAETGEIVATFCMQTWPEHSYAEIFDSAWVDQMPYGTIHRLASKYRRRGIGMHCLRWAQEHFGTLRIDTHADNEAMQALLERAGFVRCGTVYMDDSTPRIAYHWKRGSAAPSTQALRTA